MPMCTSPPNKSTHAPSFNVSIGHVAGAAGVVGVPGVPGVPGGHGTFPGPVDGGGLPMIGGFPMTGG